MKRRFLKIKIILLVLIVVVNPTFSFDQEKVTIKVAILDNFHFQPYITNDFGENFLRGVRLANQSVSKEGYRIDYKVFGYNRENPLDIFSSIKKLKSWVPDVIIAPRNSNMFLMTKNAFKDILVISPFATSDLVSRMPKNYYSLAFPDRYMALTISKYQEETYPEKTVFGLIESNCKNCMDLSQDFSKIYNKKHTDHPLIINTFVQEDVETIDIGELLNGYQDGQLFFLPNTAYSSAVLMARITNFLERQVIFIGGDDWGAWENTEVGKVHANYSYYGLRFTPASLDINSKKITEFKSVYKKYYQRSPKGDAALLGYNAVISITAALKKYGDPISTHSMRTKILTSYLAALDEHPNWFRFDKYAVYKVQSEKEEYIGSADVPFDNDLAQN